MSETSSKPASKTGPGAGVKVMPLRPCARKLAAGRLRRARCAAGLSQEEAARRCGVSVRSYGAWERGAVPLRALEALCLLEQFEGKQAA